VKKLILSEEFKRMQKLAGILNEYGNQGPTTPEVYILDTKTDEVTPSLMEEIQKISNLVYDMGGGESSYFDEYNIVIIDDMDENKVLQGLLNTSNAERKLYIKYNLENPYSFPKANKIIAAQIVYYINNLEGFAKTINDSLKSNGVFNFFSDKMYKEDKQFIKILVEKYNFFLPDNISLDSLSKHKSENLLLQRNSSFITPPKMIKYEIENTETGEKGFIQYEKIGNYSKEIVSNNFKDDFYEKNKPLEWSIFPSEDKGPILSYNPKRVKYKVIKILK